jgi:hypothetical protein
MSDCANCGHPAKVHSSPAEPVGSCLWFDLCGCRAFSEMDRPRRPDCTCPGGAVVSHECPVHGLEVPP